ncbi:hypothetical protein [Pararhizobium sp. DWP1-1-3]|uniref:hypothetical protein n=1 Tax=Pararhizobium sp. DWP1-1-3 TaxID=2804652 RepID=UPI003CF65A50
MRKSDRRDSWTIAFIVFHIMEGILLFILLWHYDFVKAAPTAPRNVVALIGQQIPAGRIDQAVANPDALQVAYNVGVLELLSLGITILGIVLALSALGGFWMIRNAAIRAAGETAQDHVREWIEEKGRAFFAEATNVQQGTSEPKFDVSQAEVAKAINEANEIKGL